MTEWYEVTALVNGACKSFGIYKLEKAKAKRRELINKGLKVTVYCGETGYPVTEAWTKEPNLNLAKILKKHALWLANRQTGEQANLSGADLSYSCFSGANISEANLSEVNLSGANLSGANLSWSDIPKANLSGASLSGADLTGVDFTGVDFTGANLSGANLSKANLSGAKGIRTAAEFLSALETDSLGIICYKRIGETEYTAPQTWKIAEGEFLVETVNPLPTIDCACGVNVGTSEWIDKNYTNADLWRCRIRWIDLADVVVPYNTDGKFRAGRVELLEKLS